MKRLLLLVLIAVSINLNAQGIYKSNEGAASFFSATPVEDIDAHSKNISSFINTGTRDVVFVIPIRNFKFKKALMEEHFNEKYLESEKYHDATFQGKINEEVDYTKDGDYAVTASGKMKIHGVEKTVTLPGTLTVKNGTLALKSEFNITIKDYDITIPKLLVSNVAEVVAVKVAASYVPYKK